MHLIINDSANENIPPSFSRMLHKRPPRVDDVSTSDNGG